MTIRSTITALFACFAFLGAPAQAQEAGEQAPALTLEFNALEPSETGCRLTFVVTNTLPAALDRAAFEMALFNKAGVVDRLTVLDFKDLPSGKTKVTRFNLSGLDCGNVGRILVNELTGCTGAGVDVAACRAALKAQSRSETVQFGL
jgi:hypothetical protein